MNTLLRLDVPLTRFNSWRIGGRAHRLFQPTSVDDWQQLCQQVPKDTVWHVLGLGSNVLIRDGGLPGITIITQNGLKAFERLDQTHVVAQAGVACGTLARFCARQGLAGLEFFAGIPGTVGGALRMNAGCFGGETWRCVQQVEVLTHSGQLRTRLPHEYQVKYRDVVTPQPEWFVGAVFALQLDEPQAIQQRIRQLIDRRQATQPNDPSCGSVFRNPDSCYAAALIEQCGLKGQTLGGAVVSIKHANFIINNGGATATDVEDLLSLVQQRVFERTGIHLISEVQVLGLKT